MESSAYFFRKAELCRRLAGTVIAPDDPAVAALRDLAARFEAKAVEAAIHENDIMADNHPPPRRSQGYSG